MDAKKYDLQGMVRRWSRPTTPEELRRGGARNLRSIDIARLAGLIELAVRRTLLARCVGRREEEENFSQDTRAEFLRLLQSDAGSSANLEGQAATEILSLRREVMERRREIELHEEDLHARESGGSASTEQLFDRDVGPQRRLNALFEEYGMAHNSQQLKGRLYALLAAEVRLERRLVMESQTAEHHREVDILARRLAKLSNLLGKTEEELAHMAQLNESDEGIPSCADGLSFLQASVGDRAAWALKSQLLLTMFNANLAMRNQPDTSRRAPG